MTKQLQVLTPKASPEACMAISLLSMRVSSQIQEVTREIAPKLGEKQSTLELELYTLCLCSCLFGVICEASDENLELQPGQAGRVQEKLKQLAIDLIVNELQDPAPQPSEN